jgi:uncharacterized protein YbjT (DUF2867 family)
MMITRSVFAARSTAFVHRADDRAHRLAAAGEVVVGDLMQVDSLRRAAKGMTGQLPLCAPLPGHLPYAPIMCIM